MGETKKGLACCEQALKINKENWKMWHNFIRFAIACGLFYKCTHAVNTLLAMHKYDNLNANLLL
jgi:hypothetical protein